MIKLQSYPKIQSNIEWLELVPKAELHLHLEGAIPLDALWELIVKYGGDPSVPNRNSLRSRLTYPNFPAFIETWIWKNNFIRAYEDFSFIAESVAGDLARQNIMYAEVFFSPSRFTENSTMTTAGITEAIRIGLNKIDKCEVWLIPDLVRDHGPKSAGRTLDEISELTQFGIVGIGAGGSEHLYPPEPFSSVYEKARKLGFKTSIHAGEAAGSESVRGALESLKVDRIGHATRAEEDPELLDLLYQTGTALELCPLSNLATGSINDIMSHPVKRYFDKGLNISINTDDPGMFHNSMAQEYELLINSFNFERLDIQKLILNAVKSSWRPNQMGSSLIQKFTDDDAWIK